MTTYKEVFQLAETKGFRSKIECIDYNPIPDTNLLQLLFATQIQKWLRDEHKAHITIESRIPYGYKHREWHSNEPTWQPTYEQALLEGINEALKLI